MAEPEAEAEPGAEAEAAEKTAGAAADAAEEAEGEGETEVDKALAEIRRTERKAVQQYLGSIEQEVDTMQREFRTLYWKGIGPRMKALNEGLRKLYAARPLSGIEAVTTPHRVAKLEKILSAWQITGPNFDRLTNFIESLRDKVSTLIATARGRPVLYNDELVEEDTPTQQRTASGCVCVTPCQSDQGTPFSWCRVTEYTDKADGTTHRCGAMQSDKDPTGWDHRLYGGRSGMVYKWGQGPKASDRFWDYCTYENCCRNLAVYVFF